MALMKEVAHSVYEAFEDEFLALLSKFPNIKYERTFKAINEFGRLYEYVLKGDKETLDSFYMSRFISHLKDMSKEELDDVFRFVFKLRNRSR